MGRSSIPLMIFLSMAVSDLAAQSSEVITLEPEDDPALESGRVALVSGVVGEEEVRYVLSDLSILQPVAVTLLSPDPDPNLEISLHSSRWEDTSRTGSLNGDARTTFRFRTQGEVGISVRSPDEREQQYDLVAWVGSEVDPEQVVDDAVVSPERYEQYATANPESYPTGAPGTEDGGASPVLIIIAAILLGILGLLAFIAVRMVRS